MWDTLDGKDVSAASLPTFDWQKDGFRMQQTNVDLARGIDEKNDPGYIPEAEMHVKSIENRDFEDGAVDFNLMQQRSENVKEHKGPFWNGGEKAFAAEEAGEGKEDAESDTQAPGVPWKLIRRICGTVGRLSAVTPVLIVALIAVSPIFFTISGLKPIRMLTPVYYYLTSIHDPIYLLWMLLYAAVCGALSFLHARLTEKV